MAFGFLFEFCIFLDCKKLHTKILKVGFNRETVLCDKLMGFYIAVSDLDSVVKVFDDMPSRSLMTYNKELSNFAQGIFRRLTEEYVVLWLAMIARYTQHDFFTEVLKLFQEMLHCGIQSDISFSSAISACATI